MRYIYLINKEFTDEYKIGVSLDPVKRLKTLQTGNSKNLVLIESFLSNFATKVEKHLHKKHFSDQDEKGEWFILTDKQVKEFLPECEKFEKSLSYLMENNIFFQKEMKKLKTY